MKGSGKPDDRKGQVRFDAAGAGNGFTVRLVRHRQTKETEQIGFTYGTPRQSSTLPSVLDSTLALDSQSAGQSAGSFMATVNSPGSAASGRPHSPR
jgi:hypothetical protein